jgi:hypothetical protein
MYCDDCSGGVLNKKLVCNDCYIKTAAEEVENDLIEKEVIRKSIIHKPKAKTLIPLLSLVLIIIGSISLYVYFENRPDKITDEKLTFFHEIEASQVASWVFEYQNINNELPENLSQVKNLTEIDLDKDLLENFSYVKIDDSRFTLRTFIAFDDQMKELSFTYPDKALIFGVKIPLKEAANEE